MKRLAKKDKGAFLLTCALNIYSGCVLDPLLLPWRKGPQTWSDTKSQSIMQTAVGVFMFLYHIQLVGTEELLFWDTALVQSCLLSGSGWCWTPPGAQKGSWSSTSPVPQAEQHLQCLPRTARVWVEGTHSSAKPPCPCKKGCKHGQLPSLGVKQRSYLSVLQDIWIFVPAEAVSKAVEAFLLYLY